MDLLGNPAMSLNPNTSFRRGALALTTAAAVVGSSLLSGSAALAGSQACAKFGNTDAGLRCEIAESNKRIEGHNRRGAEADRRGAEADRRGAEAEKGNKQILTMQACMNFITKGVSDKQFTREDVLKTAGGKLDESNVCPTAQKYGYGRRASAETPELR